MRRTDRYILDFERSIKEIPIAYYNNSAELFHKHRKIFFEELNSVWDSRDYRRYLAMASVARQNNMLAGKYGKRLALANMWAGRWREALEVLRDPRFVDDEADHHRALSKTLTALGRLAEAAEELVKAQGGAFEERDLERLQRLQETRKLQSRVGALTWEELRQLFDTCLEFDLSDLAVEALQAFLVSPRTELPPERAELLLVMRTAMELVAPTAAMNLLLLMERMCPGEYERGILRTARNVLLQNGPAKWLKHPTPKDNDAKQVLWCVAAACSALERPDLAIKVLGQLTALDRRNVDIRRSLAQSIGACVRNDRPLALRPGDGGKLFDIFPYNGEALLLKLKLEEMAGWVDYFVVVESRKTFTGKPKELLYERDRAQFEGWEAKIVYVILDDFPSYVSTPWAREFYQRDYGARGLEGLCREEDLVMLSDADEIARREAILGFTGEFANLRMDTFRYFFNCRRVVSKDQPRTGFLTRAKHLQRFGSSYLRVGIGDFKKRECIYDAGWHFSCIGDAYQVAAKMQNSSHQEYSHMDEVYFDSAIAKARRGQLEGWETCAIDDGLPSSVLRNREAMAPFLLSPSELEAAS